MVAAAQVRCSAQTSKRVLQRPENPHVKGLKQVSCVWWSIEESNLYVALIIFFKKYIFLLCLKNNHIIFIVHSDEMLLYVEYEWMYPKKKQLNSTSKHI